MVSVAQTVKPTVQTVNTSNKTKTNPIVTVGKTAGNIATNMGEGALKTGEGIVDASNSIADKITDSLSYWAIKAIYGKKKADKFKKEREKATSDFIKRDLVKEFEDKTGYSDIKDEWEKGSLVKSENIGGQIAQGVGGMVPSLIAGQYLGFNPEMSSTKGLKGLAKAKTVAENVAKTYVSQLPANAILTGSSYGGGMEEALREGADLNQARRYGLANAAIEQGTEMMTGGIPGLGGKGGIDSYVEPIINRNTNGYLNALLKAGYGAFGEGLEEYTSAMLDPLAKKIYSDEKINWNEVRKNARQAGLVGAATGAILNSPTDIQNIRDVRTENQIRNSIGDAEYAQGNQQYNPDYKGWENQRETNRINNEQKMQENNQRREEVNRVNQERAQENIRKNQELQQEKINNQENTSDYDKYYKRADLENYDSTMTEKAKEAISSNKQGKRTKQEWLDVADNIGSQLKGQDAETIKKYAYESFKSERPNVKDNLNRQGQKYVSFKVDEWVNAVQKAAQSQSSPETVQSSVETEQQNIEQTNKMSEGQEVMKQELARMNQKGYVDKYLTKQQQQEIMDRVYDEKLSPKELSEKLYDEVQKVTVRDRLIKDLETSAKENNEADFWDDVDRHYSKGNLPDFDITRNDIQEIWNKNNNVAEVKKEPVLKVETTGEKGKQHFQELGADEKIAEILSEVPRKERKATKEDLRETLRDFKRAFISKGETIERIAKETKNQNLNYMYDRLGISRGEAQEHIGSMQRNLDLKPYNNFKDANGKNTTMSLNGIREDANTHGISEQTLNEYLGNYLNVDRYPQGKPVFGDSYNVEMSQERIKQLESEHPQIKRIAENVWTFEKNQLQNMVDSGLISQNFANELNKKNPHYVRIQRNVDGISHNARTKTKGKNLQVNQQIDVAKGGNQDILPIMETIAKYTEQVHQSERVNQFGKELAKTLGMGSEDSTINSITDEESFGVNPELLKDNKDGTYSMTVFNNGVATVVPINQGIYESLTPNKTIQSIENNDLFRKITYPTKKMSEMFRTLTTDKNPVFMFTNAFRDIGDAPFNSKYTTEFAKTYLSTEALRQVAGDGVYNQLYEAAGGKQNSYFNNGEFVDKTQTTASKIKDKLLMPIEKGNEMVESVPRMAEFIATIKANGYEVNSNGELVVKNKNKATKSANEVLNEALYNAAEVTTNFKRGGDVTKFFNRNGATFLNASVQGFDKQIRNFSALASGDKKQIVMLLTKALIFGIAPTMLNDAMHDDDDEYKEMQEYQKDNYYLFKGKDGQWIRIPKGRAMSVVGGAFRRGKNYLQGDKKAFEGFGKFAADQVAPNSIVSNNILSPISQVKNNESWSGNKIISDSMAIRPSDEQYNEKTDEISKFIGKAIKNLPLPKSMKNFKSPLAIHYLLDQYTGAVGDTILPMITEKSSSKYNPLVAPFVSKFTADSVYSNKSVSEYYDKKSEIKTQKNSEKATPIDVAKNSYMDSKNYEIANLYKQQRQIQNNKSLSKEEKYDKAREKQKEINRTAKQIVKDVENIEENEYYLKIGDYYYKKVIKDGEEQYVRDSSKKIPTEKYALYDYFKDKYEKSKEESKG